MQRKAFLLSFLFFLIFSVKTVLAEENTYFFPEEEILIDLTSEEAEKVLTIADMNSLMESCIEEVNKTKFICNLYFKKSLYQDSDELATVEMFLKNFINYLDGKIIDYQNNEFIYFAGNSMWMSNDEWKKFLLNLDGNITYGDVYVFFKRTESLYAFTKKQFIPKDFDAYCAVINNLFPIFNDLIEEDIKATKAWFDIMQNKKGNTTTWRTDAISNIIHELQHEISAKKSGVFTKRGINSDGKYSVSWKELPEVFWYYNPLKQEWISIDTNDTLPNSEGMGRFLNKEIKNIGLYKNYISNKTSASNNYAIYGMLTELISYSLELRMYAIASNYTYMDSYVSNHYKETTGFMISSILQYFQFLKETQPYMYKQLMKDTNLKNLILDTMCYIEESYRMVKEFKYGSEDFELINNWKIEILDHYLKNENYFTGKMTLPNFLKKIKSGLSNDSSLFNFF